MFINFGSNFDELTKCISINDFITADNCVTEHNFLHVIF